MISTTLQQTIVPDPIPADAQKPLPYELSRYAQNGLRHMEPRCGSGR